MNCFNHETEMAIGICKNCSKAICRKCSKDLGVALACSDSCAEDALAMHEMVQRAKKLYGMDGGLFRIPLAAFVPVLTGVLFLGFAALTYSRKGTVEPLTTGMGVIMLVVAIAIIVRSRSVGLRL